MLRGCKVLGQALHVAQAEGCTCAVVAPPAFQALTAAVMRCPPSCFARWAAWLAMARRKSACKAGSAAGEAEHAWQPGAAAGPAVQKPCFGSDPSAAVTGRRKHCCCRRVGWGNRRRAKSPAGRQTSTLPADQQAGLASVKS